MTAPWVFTDDPDDPCVYCVQWRCPTGEHTGIEELHCVYEHEWEPYWPDGSVPPRVRRGACERCEVAIARYLEESDGL